MSGTFFLVTFPSEPYHYNWVCFNILNSEWVQLLAYRRCLINICGIRAGYDSDLSPALRPPPVRAGCISGYDSDPSPPSPPPVQVGCITGSGLNSPISSQHPTVRHRKTFMKSPCDHGISLHSSLCYLSNSLWIKKKKKKRRARSWTLPTRYSFHSLLCSRFLRSHRPLLWASRALGLPLSHARGGFFVHPH